MKKINNLLKKTRGAADRFSFDESGMELLQFAIVVVISVFLVSAVAAIANAVNSTLEAAAEQVNDMDVKY